MNQLWLAFITGLTTGGISCLAVQGGLLTSSITSQTEKKESAQGNWKFIAMFLTAKLVGYTILGVLLGSLGSFIVLSLHAQAYLQVAVGLFLLATAGRLLNLHPIFRYFVIQPPKFIYKLARSESKKKEFFAPALLGFLTVLMPCGVTQATMAVALATGNPILGGAIMFAFTLGTSPVFFALGIGALELMKKKAFSYVAAGVVSVFGIMSINGALGLLGSPHTLQNYYKVIISPDINASEKGKIAGVNSEGTQEVTVKVLDTRYVSDTNTITAGVPVKLKLVTDKTYGCSRAFTIPSLNISKILPETGETIIEFTPIKKGRLAYACSMGMYTGSFTVI